MTIRNKTRFVCVGCHSKHVRTGRHYWVMSELAFEGMGTTEKKDTTPISTGKDHNRACRIVITWDGWTVDWIRPGWGYGLPRLLRDYTYFSTRGMPPIAYRIEGGIIIWRPGLLRGGGVWRTRDSGAKHVAGLLYTWYFANHNFELMVYSCLLSSIPLSMHLT